MSGAVTQWLGIWASDTRRVPGGICIHPWLCCLPAVASRACGMAPTYQRGPLAGTAHSLFWPRQPLGGAEGGLLVHVNTLLSFCAVLSSCGFNFLILRFQIRLKPV